MGATEPEVPPWLRADGHDTRSVPDVKKALAALDEAPADLVVVDHEARGADTRTICIALREDPRLGDAWLLAITGPTRARLADQALDSGADDYLHRPFTRAQLLARARAGLRASRQRADAALLRTLMVNVPGAIYRSAWHADHTLELISDEIERISGYPPTNFIASARRTIMSIIHPDDRPGVIEEVRRLGRDRTEPFQLEYRIVRADGEVRWVLDRGQLVPGPGGRLWMDGAIFDVTERRAAEEALRRRQIEQARTEELRASRARIVAAADNARRRIERDLHDGAQQRLVALSLTLRLAQGKVHKDPEKAVELLGGAQQELTLALGELRELARGIHPAVLSDRGLAAALESLAGRAPLPVELGDVPEDRLPEPIEAAAYFVVAEALTNVVKYAHASQATVSVERRNGHAIVEVADDGIGGADPDRGSGLRGLVDRVSALDGSMRLDSPAGAGTRLRAEIPV